MSEFLKDWKVILSGTCGAVTITGEEDGLVDYNLVRTNKNVVLGDSESVKGTAPIKFKLSRTGTLTITAYRGSDLEEKLSTASLLNAIFIGNMLDTRSSTQSKNFSFIGGITKPDIQYSTDTLDFEVVGNFQDIVI